MFALTKRASPQEKRQRFEELALPHMDALFGASLRLLGSPRDAEDLVQDTLLRAYQAFDQFDGDRKCKPWLFRILMNTFINRYRRRVLEQRVAEALVREREPLVSQGTLVLRDPEAALSSAALSDEIQQALGQLPEEFRLTVLLADMEEFSYKEMAEIMDCPVGTVMSRLHRGRRLLKELLRKYAVSEGIVRPAAEERGEVIPLRGKSPGKGGE
jgi:RNA polymerase sigma-70 factor (ECF subfamily)